MTDADHGPDWTCSPFWLDLLGDIVEGNAQLALQELEDGTVVPIEPTYGPQTPNTVLTLRVGTNGRTLLNRPLPPSLEPGSSSA